MPEGRKIVTCCYCGTRAVLVFDRARHELACSACGAPIHNMKPMPQYAEKKLKNKKKEIPAASRRRLSGPLREISRDGAPDRAGGWKKRPRKTLKKKRKPLMKRFFEELLDEVEDIFD